MISVSGITVSFDGIDLFNNLSFLINTKDRIGLVGKNGVGKSTLLKILAGTKKAQSGSVDSKDGFKIGYLPQEIKINSEKSIFDEAMMAFEESLQAEKEINHITKQLEERTDYESDSYMDLITRLNELHETLQLEDSALMESKIEKVLKGLGFSAEDFSRPISEFSGGWQMRVELSKLLLMQPDLMLLDEPTNHLDIESILWLEDFFKNYHGSIMMVSHDRMFLDNVTNRTIELVKGNMYDYKHSYSNFLVLREERIQMQLAAKMNQDAYIRQQERFIERFKAKASKAKQAQSKLKQLEKIEEVTVDIEDNTKIKFRFPPAPRSGDIVIKAENLQMNYDEKQVFNNVKIDIERGEKVAFVGKNGMGKTTMVKLINGMKPTNGVLKIGHNVIIGYYAQVQENTLDSKLSIFETIDNIATGEWRNVSRIRGLLGSFLFGEEDIDKKVSVLSGGEKSRLALAKLLLNPINLLILDEPTNHLDIASKKVLKEALHLYNGSMILVSHDRDFLQGLTNKTYEFIDGTAKEHLGSIDEFLEKKKHENFREFEMTKKSLAKKVESQKKEASVNKVSYEDKKEKEKEIRRLKKEVSKAEKKVEITETRLSEIEAQMADPNNYEDDASKDIFYEHADLKKDLDRYLKRWEDLVENLDKLEG